MARNPKQDANLGPPFDSNQSREEASKNGRKGGQKSGEVRRAKRTAREAAQRLLAMPAKGKMRDNLLQLGYDPKDVEGLDNIDVIVARLMVLAASGKLEANDRLLRIAGYDAEENRKERESINADRRRDRESEARLLALEKGDVQRYSTTYTDGDEDSSVEDVLIYLPDNGRDKDLQKPVEAKEEAVASEKKDE